MALRVEQFRGSVRDPIQFTAEQGGDVLFSKLKESMEYELRCSGVPAVISTDVVKSGGMFGSKCPILLISHPDSYCRYFSIGMYVNGQTVYFPLLGESAENTKMNKKQYYKDSGNFIRAAMINYDEFKLQQEIEWQANIMACFDELLK